MKYVYDQGVVKRSVARLVLGVAAFVLISQAFSGVLYTRSARAEGSTSSAIVYQDDFANSMMTWTYQNDNTSAATPDPTSEHEIVARPGGSTQSNNGAVKLQGDTTGSRWNLASLQYSGQKISEITSLGFDLRTSNPGSAYINLDVDFNHAGISGWQGRLVYVPTGVVANAWGSYDAVANGGGLWKWSRMWGTSPMTAWPDGITAEARTWNEIKTAFPDARITAIDNVAFGSLYLRSDGTAETYYDNVYLGTSSAAVAYNFELPKPDAPTLVAPANNAVVKGASLTNSWNPVEDAVKYVYESYRNEEATDLRWDEELTTTSKTATNVSDDTFWWRVKAVDADGVESDWSELWKVTVDNTAPTWSSTPYHVRPDDPTAEVTVGSEIIMDWVDATDTNPGVTYQYQVSFSDEVTGPDAAFLAPIWTWDNLSESQLDATGTAPGTYYWHVRACDAAGNCTRWTDPWEGTVVEASSESVLGSSDTGGQFKKSDVTPSPAPKRSPAQTGGRGGVAGTAVQGRQADALPIQFAIAGTPAAGTDDIPTIGTDVEETNPDALGQVLGAEQTLGQATGGIGGSLQSGSLLTEPRVIAPVAVVLSGGLFWWLVAAWRRRSEY